MMKKVCFVKCCIRRLYDFAIFAFDWLSKDRKYDNGPVRKDTLIN